MQRLLAAPIAASGIGAAVAVTAILVGLECGDETVGPLAATPLATKTETTATPEPTATPENLALETYVEHARSVLDRRSETQEAADDAIDALKAAAASDFMTPVWSEPVPLSSLTEEEIRDYFFNKPALPEEWQQALTDTVARLRSVLDAAEEEEAGLRGLEVPAEVQRVHELLTGSLSKQSSAWHLLLNHCSQVLKREVRWDESQVERAEQLLLEAKVDRLEAQLELAGLVRIPSAQTRPHVVQDIEPPVCARVEMNELRSPCAQVTPSEFAGNGGPGKAALSQLSGTDSSP